ncbi:MAG TPA: hypothetical protein DEB39_02530, partial [Planctomycetaceae bacterium]|nr:hypothetical protein [Planctomycetaceae bacterium]
MPFQFRFIPFIPLLLAVVVGCASHGDRLRLIRASFYQGDMESARAGIDEHLKRPKQREGDVLKLDQAIIDLTTGNTRQAESTLREVRDRFELLEQKTAAEGIGSMLTDDNAVAYAGEDYEKVLIRVFLALANLMHDGGDAGAYALQVGQKQDRIVQSATKMRTSGDSEEEVNPKLAYKRVPVGVYLYGVMREGTLMNYDDAVRSYQTVVEWLPEFEQAQHDLERARSGVHSKPENGVVYVFGLVGRGPYKEQVNAEVSQTALFAATMIINALGSRSVTPGIAPVLIPMVVQPRNLVGKLKVEAEWEEENVVCLSETITDVGKMAEEQCAAVETQTIARAVARRAVKKGILYGIKEATDANPYVSLAMDIGGMIWEGRETADTRCWGLLPETIQVARLELPAGDRRIT